MRPIICDFCREEDARCHKIPMTQLDMCPNCIGYLVELQKSKSFKK